MSLPAITEAFIDADFAIKVGQFLKRDVIVDVLPKLVGVLFIHEYVFEKEILIPQRVKDQLNVLVQMGRAKIVDHPAIDEISPDAFHLYQETIKVLASLDETKSEGKHWGEVVTLAAAKVLNVPFMLSDESRLQMLVDDAINSNNPNRNSPGDIQVYRISDMIKAMREIGEDRKTAMAIWLLSGNKADANRRKEIFKRELWPFEQMQK